MIVWKLDEVLRVKGVKGRELARRMEIGENYLSRVRHEVPERLSLMLLDGLCRELGCTIADLLEYQPGETLFAPLPAPTPAPVKRAAAKAPPRSPGRATKQASPTGERPVAASVAAHQPVEPVAAESTSEDFDAIVAAALGAAFDEPVEPEEPGALTVPQTRWSEAPIPEAAVPAEPESPRTDATGAKVVRTSALNAKLGRLKQRRPL